LAWPPGKNDNDGRYLQVYRLPLSDAAALAPAGLQNQIKCLPRARHRFPPQFELHGVYALAVEQIRRSASHGVGHPLLAPSASHQFKWVQLSASGP